MFALSINPTYLCNFRCKFCYLTKTQLSDKKTLKLNQFRVLLETLVYHKIKVNHVDLYGGEIGLLSEEYLNELDFILHQYYQPSISLITNFYKISPYFYKDHLKISVSFEFEARERYEQVLNNMISFGKPIALLMLASKDLMKKDVNEMILTLNSIKNITSVEIKSYSSNQANQLDISYKQYDDFVKSWIDSPVKNNFLFINKKLIQGALNKHRHIQSYRHLFITPNGKFALTLVKNNHEIFVEFESLEEALLEHKKQKQKMVSGPVCSQCDYKNYCLVECYREVFSLENSCSGSKNLLDWYRKEKHLSRHPLF